MHKLTVSFLLSAFLLSSVSVSALPLKVLSATPKGTLTEPGRQTVTVTFNQPVAALSAAHAFAADACPLQLSPAVAGTCRYVGTQTLTFEPAQNWPPATAFTARVSRGFTSAVSGEKLSAPYTFSFTSPRPQVRQVYPNDGEHWLTLTPAVYVGFSQEMNEVSAARLAYLKDAQDARVSLSARFATQEEREKHFYYLPSEKQILVFTPRKPLQKDTAYTLVLPAGLKGAQGPLGLAKEYTSTFHTYPDLHVLGVKQNGCLPFTPQVRFSSPVRLRELAAAMHVTPAGALAPLTATQADALGTEVVVLPFAKLSDAAKNNFLKKYALLPEEQKNGTAFFATDLSFLRIQPHQQVRVTLDKSLTDIYGNRLGQDYTFTVDNSGYCPAVDFSGGYGVLESYLPPRLPVELINMPAITVRAARFNKENYIPFLTATDNAYCAEKPLADPTFSGPYTFRDVKDKTLKTYLDLTRFHPTAQDSLVFSQLNIKRGEEDCWVSSTDNLTDVGLTFKVSPETILLWATSLETGEPMANLAVELRDRTNTILWSGSTDMNGLARAPGWLRLDTPVPSWGAPKLYAFVSSAGGDGFISTELDDGLEPWRFNVSYTYNPQQEEYRTFLFTERGLYRPGETVHLAGIFRRWKNSVWTVPETATGKVVVSDAAGTEVFSDDVNIRPGTGTFEVSFTAPATAHSGDWEAAFTPNLPAGQDPSATYAYFKVESVKQAEFSVSLQADKEGYLPGQEALFTAAANYQFGAPLVDAPAKWTLRREMAWFEPEAFKGYNFTPYFLREGEYKEDGKLLASTSEKTNAQGLTSFRTRLPQVSAPVRVFAEADVQSPAKQDVFSRASAMLHPAAFYLGVKTPDTYARAGQPFSVSVVAVTTDGKRTSAPAVVAQIAREEWRSVRKVGLSGRLEWVSDKEVRQLPAQSFDVSETDGVFSFTPDESGYYVITFLTSDDQGRPVRGGFDVMVYGKDGPAWAQKDDDLLTLKQDKNVYHVGDTARISVESPYDTAQALVSVEREGVLDAWTVSLKGGADYVEVPIKEHYLPNVFVSVTLVKGRTAAPVNEQGVDLGKPQGKTGYVNLKVEAVSQKIAVDIRTNKKSYRPGDEVTVRLTTQSGRKGVPAQVILFAVDEGVLALTDYKTPDPFAAFYGERPLSVFTSDNRSYVIGQRNFGEKGENRGGGGSSFAKLGGADLRSRFSFVPYYQTQVMTDRKGRAEVKFKLPDNLTRFRIMAVAVRTQQFGSAQTQINVSKPLMVTAQVPGLLRQGDRFSCSAVVYNYADKKGVITVSAAAEGAVQLTAADKQTVSVPLGQAREISWPCSAGETGSARVVFSAKARGESDAVQANVTVQTVEKPQTLAVYNTTSSSKEELLQRPDDILPHANNRVEVALSSTALLNLQGALRYLTTYPYDCLEQQLSKIRPVVQSKQLVQAFGLGDIAQFEKQAQDVLTNLPAYQHDSGGFSYWKHDLPDPYVTAYALETAYWAKQAGFTVAEKPLQKAADWLEKAFAQQEPLAFIYSVPETQTAHAYSLYVLALYGKTVTPAFNNFYARMTTLPVPALAYLLQTAQATDRTDYIKQTLAQQILNHVAYTPSGAYFTAREEMPWLHVNDVFTTALVTQALLGAGQPFEHAPQAVSWLLTQQNAQGHWGSTTGNAAVWAALQTYVNTTESDVPDFTAQAKINPQATLAAQFVGRTLDEKKAHWPFETVYEQSPQARVEFTKTGRGTLYYSLSQTYTPRTYSTPVNAGLEISRRLTDLDGQEVTTLQAGHRYYVTLTVRSAAARHFVVAEDFVPAGVTVVNTSLATESAAPDELLTSRAFERTERYEGRIAAFADYLPAGTHTFTYVISAVTDGTFAYPGAWAELMYEPAVFGRTASSEITIRS